MLKVYGASLSPFARKVLLTLEFKGLSYEHIPTSPFAPTPEFLAKSPLRKIPVLDHDDLSIPDSSIICRYLEEAFPAKPFYPASAKDRARASWIEEYADTKLIEIMAAFFFERFVKPNLLKQPPDEARVANAAAQAPAVMAYLESIAPASGFLFGDLTIADASIASMIINGQYAGYSLDKAATPKLAALLDRVLATPVFVARLAKERVDMAALAGG